MGAVWCVECLKLWCGNVELYDETGTLFEVLVQNSFLCYYHILFAIITFFLLLSHSFCYYHILSYSLGSFFYKYMVVFLFNTEIYVFLLEEAMYSYC